MKDGLSVESQEFCKWLMDKRVADMKANCWETLTSVEAPVRIWRDLCAVVGINYWRSAYVEVFGVRVCPPGRHLVYTPEETGA